MSISWKVGLAVVALGLSVPSAQAASIECLPNNERVAILGSATACGTLDSANINSGAGVNAALGTSFTWGKEGEVSPGDNATGTHANDLLSITLLAGSWGANSNISGTWNIDPSFWTTYGKAAITMHVGQGNGSPDAFAWLITQGVTSGTFSYYDKDGRGGGLSNMFLFGTQPPVTTGASGNVPEPNHALLMVLGMLSVLAVRFGGPRLLKARQAH